MNVSQILKNSHEWKRQVKEECEKIGIEHVVTKAIPCFSEFVAFIEIKRSEADTLVEGNAKRLLAYLMILDDFITFLKERYKFTLPIVMVASENYTPKLWGNLYWKFLHFSSILLQHELSRSLIDLRRFPTIVQNIDEILPCSICAHHYRQIKNGTRICSIIKRMSFGHVMQATSEFHNAVTANIREQSSSSAVRHPSRFSDTDFCEEYHCYPITVYGEYGARSSFYRGPIHFEPDIVIALSKAIRTEKKAPYLVCSNWIKKICNVKPLLDNSDLSYYDGRSDKWTEKEIVTALLKKYHQDDEKVSSS
jgi:hypothetical protein